MDATWQSCNRMQGQGSLIGRMPMERTTKKDVGA